MTPNATAEMDETEPTEFDPNDYAPSQENVHTCSGCGASWAGFYDDDGKWRIVEYSACVCRE